MFEASDPYEELKNSMGYWYPLLQQIRMRTPKTVLVHSDIDLNEYLESEKDSAFVTFIERLQTACQYLGNGEPVFLRTAQTSDKHSWNYTCYVRDYKKIQSNVMHLVESSVMANIAGMPWNTNIWAVRQMLPVKKHFEAFDGMPITTEYRMFIKDGKTQCMHEYWPDEAFEDEKQKQQRLGVYKDIDTSKLRMMSDYVARYFHDYWSVDFLLSEDGQWYCIDMAVGDRSYHDPSCKFSKVEESK